MEGEQPAARTNPVTEGQSLLPSRPHVACVGDDGVRRSQCGNIRKVLVDAAAHTVVASEKLKDLQPRIVEVMPATAADEGDIHPARCAASRGAHRLWRDRSWSGVGQNWVRTVMPPSHTMFVPTQKPEAGLAR